MVTTIQEVNITEALAFHFGESYSDLSFQFIGKDVGNNSLSEAWIWNDLIVTEPSESDMITWETDRLSAIDANNTSIVNIKSSLAIYDLTLQDYELIVTIEQLCAGVFLSGGNPTISTMHSTLVSLLTGSSFQTATVNYVKRVAGVASIGTDLAREFNVAMQFLRILKGAYETKNGL